MNHAIERLAEELGTLSDEEWAAAAKRHPSAADALMPTEMDSDPPAGRSGDKASGADQP